MFADLLGMAHACQAANTDPSKTNFHILSSTMEEANMTDSIERNKKNVVACYQVWPGNLEYAGIDIFRLDNEGRILDHWDVLQVIPDTSKNHNGMF